MKLALDIARCHGAHKDNERDGESMPPCVGCERRLQIERDPEFASVSYMVPPLFMGGNCHRRLLMQDLHKEDLQ